MCSGNLFKKIIVFCIPLALMGMLQLLYNTADLIIVSNFSGDSEALGAVGSTSSLINLIVNLFMGLSVGTNVICAKMYGAKNYDGMNKAIHTSILLSLIFGIVMGLFGIIFCDALLNMMSNDLYLSRVYLRIYFIGLPFNMVYNFASAVMRAVGDTKRPLYYLSLAGIINVILNLVFVIIFDMSVAGVALATVISQVICAFLVIRALINSKEPYRLNIKELKLHKKEMIDIIRIGLPAGIQSSIFAISNVIIQSSVNKFGTSVMNGNSAASSVEAFVYVAMNSVYHAALAFTGQNVGAQKSKNITKVTIYSLIIVTMIAIILGGTLFIFGKEALWIYTKDPTEIDIGYIRLHYLCLPYFLCGIMDVMVGVLRGLGYSTLPMIVSIVGVCGIRIAWIYGYFYPRTDFLDYNDLNMLYISYPISWIITFIIHLSTYLVKSKQKFKEINNKLIIE